MILAVKRWKSWNMDNIAIARKMSLGLEMIFKIMSHGLETLLKLGSTTQTTIITPTTTSKKKSQIKK